jgi:hypothetical protein
MLEDVEMNGVLEKLTKEFDALIEERQDIRNKTDALNTRADEIDRKVAGIQKALHGLLLYANAQEEPTEVLKQTVVSLEDVMSKITAVSKVGFAGPNVKKTLSECCRDILRKKQDWMTPVEIRDALLAAGFDFSNYTSNPLSSIHTTIKRMVPDEVATANHHGRGQVYRWIGPDNTDDEEED